MIILLVTGLRVKAFPGFEQLLPEHRTTKANAMRQDKKSVKKDVKKKRSDIKKERAEPVKERHEEETWDSVHPTISQTRFAIQTLEKLKFEADVYLE